MSFPELLDAARALPRDEQLRLANALLEPEIGSSDPTPDEALMAAMFPPGQVMEIWSPYDAHEAAEVLQRLLDETPGK